MKRLFVLSIGMLVLLAATLPLMAQEDGSRIYAYPPTNIANVPHNPGVPIGTVPASFSNAYGFNLILNQGQGQTIALVDPYDDPNIVSDLAAYATQFTLAPCNFQKVKVGAPMGNSAWGLIESADVEQACALAPQATILLVEANSNSLTDLLTAVEVAYSAPYNASVVSMNWGFAEFSGELGSDSYFCNIVNPLGQAVTFVASTGDGGHGTLYPSVSPCVIAAGGTSLSLATTSGIYGTETAWNLSGGGLSLYEAQPSFQNPACATWSTSARCVPDISSDDDPSLNTGVAAYDTYGYPGWVEVGGVATPDWAAFFTLVNSQRVNLGLPTLSQAIQQLYTIYYSSNYLTDFHDITSGTNSSILCGSPCIAGIGYDLVTGIGSYQANQLCPALVPSPTC
ncbi:MAG: S53 family peptidase [Candidatus Korobacteraceae bacterium]|jgi:subtilase family serine protease